MRYLACLLALFLLLNRTVVAQAVKKDSTADLVAYWKKGDKKRLSIAFSKTVSEKGQVKDKTDLLYEALVEVLDSSEFEYKVQWTFQIPDAEKARNPALGLLPVYNGMKMIFTTSEVGEFRELLNWEEVRDAYIRMAELSMPAQMNDTAREAYQKAKDLFSSKEMVESAMIKEIKLYYSAFGSSYSTAPIKAASTIPSPFGGDPIPVVATQQVTELRPKQDYFKLAFGQKVDKGGATKVLMEFFSKMGVGEEAKAGEVQKILADLEMTDQYHYQVKISTGWISKMSFHRIVNIQGRRNTESYVLSLK